MRCHFILGTALLLMAPTVFAKSVADTEFEMFLTMLFLMVVIPCAGLFMALLPLLASIEEENQRRKESRGGGIIEY